MVTSLSELLKGMIFFEIWLACCIKWYKMIQLRRQNMESGGNKVCGKKLKDNTRVATQSII